MCGTIILIILVLIFAPLLSQETVTIHENEVGVLFNVLSGELDDPLQPGIYQINPSTQEVRVYSTSSQEFRLGAEENLQGRTNDGQIVIITASLTYKIDPQQVNMIHARWRDTYGPSFIRPTFRGVIREVISRFSLAETETKLAEIREEILANMEQRLSDEGLILENLTIDAITLSE